MQTYALENDTTVKVDAGGVAFTLRARENKCPQIVCYGFDRATFNQGANAQYDFLILDDESPTITARGPGGGDAEIADAICSREFKGPNEHSIHNIILTEMPK